jgi:flagellar protein FliS
MSPMPIDTYRAVDVTTADPLALTLLLFDEAIRRLSDAIRALGRGDQGGFARAQAAAHAIVFALGENVDLARGGEIAQNLTRLYDFMLRHLTEGLLQRDAAPLEHVRALLTELRDGFAGIRP